MLYLLFTFNNSCILFIKNHIYFLAKRATKIYQSYVAAENPEITLKNDKTRMLRMLTIIFQTSRDRKSNNNPRFARTANFRKAYR